MAYHQPPPNQQQVRQFYPSNTSHYQSYGNQYPEQFPYYDPHQGSLPNHNSNTYYAYNQYNQSLEVPANANHINHPGNHHCHINRYMDHGFNTNRNYGGMAQNGGNMDHGINTNRNYAGMAQNGGNMDHGIIFVYSENFYCDLTCQVVC
eukprot:162429_1